jgi:formylglycine-generating enzyme required for sulfatase activity
MPNPVNLVTLSLMAVACAKPSSTQDADNSQVSAGTKHELQFEGVTFEFRWCPAGQFLMDSPPGADSKYGLRFEQQHKVKLTRGYWMMATEVTQLQFVAITGENPSSWQGGIKCKTPWNTSDAETRSALVKSCQLLTK